MQTLRSRSKVQRVREEDGEFLVAFALHDGYFSLPASPGAPEMREKILKAQQAEAEIAFEYDRDLNILRLL
ncbi:MAG: hypothetical protein KGL10_04120 [Alphaproteobacteria bacterium]|nr:hypothetical protein [Alphaproteobacteria bacterium]MDE2336474.1 hypothetical protein [Alphaproteobacteria bacterium]